MGPARSFFIILLRLLLRAAVRTLNNKTKAKTKKKKKAKYTRKKRTLIDLVFTVKVGHLPRSYTLWDDRNLDYKTNA